MPAKVLKPKKVVPPLEIENAFIFYRNFSGTASAFNAAGQMNFALRIPEEMVEKLVADGWNIKQTKPRANDPEAPIYNFTTVKVVYDRYPPEIVLVNGATKAQTVLTKDTVKLLDSAEILNVDLVVRPYVWSNAKGESGVKGYVKTMYVTVQQNRFAHKYQQDHG